MMTTLFRALAVVAFGLAVVACTGDQKQGEQITLRYYLWGTPTVVSIHENVVKLFEQAYPNIKVHIESAGWGGYWDKLQIQLASNTAADVFWMSGAYYHNLAHGGVFLNLTPYIKRDSINLDEHFLEKTFFDNPDTIFAFPKDMTTVVLFYNKDMFDKEHLEYPNESWDWNDFVFAATRLTKDHDRDGKPDQWGVAPFTPLVEEYIAPAVFSNGGTMLDPQKSRCVLDRPEAREAVQFLVDLMRKYKVCPGLGEIVSVGGDAFSTGQAAMIQNISALVPEYSKITKFRWDIAPIPKSPNTGHRVTSSTGLGHVINANTKYPEESWELVKFLSSEKAARMLAQNKVFIPSPRKVAEEVYAVPPPDHIEEVLKAYNYSRDLQFTRNALEWNHIIERELQPAFLGTKTVAEACRAAVAAVNKVVGPN